METEKTKPNILDQQTYQKLISIQKKTLTEMICYLWINQLNSKDPISIIDAVEFDFSDGDKIVLSGNESQEGLTYIEYNFEEQKKMLEKEFDGKIKAFKVKANDTEMWKDIINTQLIKIIIEQQKNTNYYLSDEILFEFENNQKRIVRVHPLDGVILDYYEEM